MDLELVNKTEIVRIRFNPSMLYGITSPAGWYVRYSTSKTHGGRSPVGSRLLAPTVPATEKELMGAGHREPSTKCTEAT